MNNQILESLKNHQFDFNVFMQLFNMMKTSISIADATQTSMPLIYVNDHFSSLTGYHKDDVLGLNCNFLQGDQKDQKNKEVIKKALNNQEACKVELINFKKDGTRFINLLNLTPIFDNNEKLIYYIGIQVDITDQVEHFKFEGVKEISSGLTHEVNTLLSTLCGNLDILTYDIEDIQDEKIQISMNESLENIRNSHKNICKIVNSFHYLDSPSIELHEQFSVYETLEEAVSFFAPKIKAMEICVELINDMTDKRVLINADKKSIMHLWKILIENAIDALCEKNDDRKLQIKLKATTYNVYIDIKDNGHGMTQDIQRDLFKPFVKGKDYKGIGINLNTAQKIAEMNNGQISFITNQKGTEFIIMFPKKMV